MSLGLCSTLASGFLTFNLDVREDRNQQLELFSWRNHLKNDRKLIRAAQDNWLWPSPMTLLFLNPHQCLTQSYCWHGPTSHFQDVLQQQPPPCVYWKGWRGLPRLGYSLLLCTPTGNVRESNLLSREEQDFLRAEIRHWQTEVLLLVLLHGMWWGRIMRTLWFQREIYVKK